MRTGRLSLPTPTRLADLRALIGPPLGYALWLELGQLLTFTPTGAVAFWPASGFGAGVVSQVRGGRRWCRAAILVSLQGLLSLAHGASLTWAIVYALTSAMEMLLAARVIDALGGAPALLTLDGLTRLLAGPVLGATAAAALVGSIAITALGAGGHTFGITWARWCSADALGMLVVLPAMLVWQSASIRSSWSTRTVLEGTLVLVITVSAMLTLDGGGHTAAVSCIMLPALLWATSRTGQKGVTLLALPLALAILGLALLGFGPFGDAVDWRVFSLQTFLGTLLGGALAVAAACDQLRGRFAPRRVRGAVLEQVIERHPSLFGSSRPVGGSRPAADTREAVGGSARVMTPRRVSRREPGGPAEGERRVDVVDSLVDFRREPEEAEKIAAERRRRGEPRRGLRRPAAAGQSGALRDARREP